MADRIAELIERFGYAAVAVLMFVENVFPPIPSEPALLLAGAGVHDGTLTFAGVLVAATVGSVLGSIALYALAYFGGRPLLERHGRLLRVSPTDLERAERWFDRWGPWLVLGARVVPLARSLVSLPAGVVRMKFWLFVTLTTIGSLVWNTAIVSAGWAVGDNWRSIAEALGVAGTVTGAVLALALAVLWVWWRRRRSRTITPRPNDRSDATSERAPS